MASHEIPQILIVTGTICSGKTTLVGNLIAKDGFNMLGAETTRPARSSDLPGEYTYLTDEEFDALPRSDMIFSTKHGSPSRYTLLRTTVESALADAPHLYTRPLSPESAGKVIHEYGQDRVKALYLPSPDPEERERRASLRGDDPSKVAARVQNEASWDVRAQFAKGIHIAVGRTIEELHAEALDIMSQS